MVEDMLVHLRQYKHEEADFDDNRTTGESQTEDTVDKDSEEYFGENIDNLETETWETVEHDGDPIERRSVSIGEVTAVSVRRDSTEDNEERSDPDLPGQRIQIRLAGGDTEFIEQAMIIEVQDENPQPEA